MRYLERKELVETGLRPLPHRPFKHFIFFESESEVLKVYHPITRRTLDLTNEIREWLWFNVDGRTEPWPGFPMGSFRKQQRWTYELSRLPVSTSYLNNGYIAFEDKDHATLFKLTWQ